MNQKTTRKQPKSSLKELEAEIQRLQHVEAELNRSLQFTESLLSAVPIPVFFKDAEGRYLGCNKAFTEIIGVTPGEIKGKKVYELWPSEHAEMYHQKDLEVMHNLEHQTYEFVVKDKHGTDRSVIFSKDVFLDEKGKADGLVGSFVDITERKRAEEKLRESEAFLKQLNETLEDRVKERVKELNCLYDISALGYKPQVSLDENIQGIVNLIPPAWQYPDVVCSRIILEGEEFRTPNFKETPWRQSCEIILNQEHIGRVEVFSLKEMPERDEGPFLAEERLLIEAIAEHVSRNVERHRSEESIKSLSGDLIRIQESERHRISRDLHDKVAQDLASLKIAIETLFRDIPEIVCSQSSKISNILKILEESIRSVRKISYDLHPAGLDDMGIAVALEMLCNEYSEHNAIDIGFHAAGIEKLKIDSNTQINLYRIVQEGLNNICRHAEAKNVRIKLVAAYPNIILRMEDDGKGFEIQKRMRETVFEKRMGLMSMRERANLLGGKMRITSKEGEGTKVVVKFPFTKK
ncbi:MAG: PAS domain-containing protein [Desulfobacterales bacterium]